VMTCDPNVCANAIPLPYLTFDEAAELGMFGAQVFSLVLNFYFFVDQNCLGSEHYGIYITSFDLYCWIYL
jgi:hypothetical protein